MQTERNAGAPIEGQSSLHESSSQSCVTHGSFYGRTRPQSVPKEDHLRRPYEYQRVMMLDGGINHQLAVLSFLKELMLVIIKTESNKDPKVQSSSDSPLVRWSRIDDGFRLCHYFDYISGTSWGGISAILLGRMRLKVDDALTAVQQISDARSHKIPQEPRSSASATWSRMFFMPRYLKQLLHFESDPGRDVQTEKGLTSEPVVGGIDQRAKFESTFGFCRTLIVSSNCDDKHQIAPFILRSYEILDPEGRDLRNPSQPTHRLPISDVYDATLAPSSHPWNIDVPGMDDFYHDTPSKEYNARDEVEKEIAALHLGSTEHFEYKLTNEMRMPNYPKSRSWFSSSVARNAPENSLGDICLDGLPLELPRLPQIQKSNPASTIEALIQDYCSTGNVKEVLSSWAEKMVAARRHRAGFERWETFAFGVHYKCCVCEDDGRNSGFMDVDTWGLHVADKHGMAPFTIEERCRVMP